MENRLHDFVPDDLYRAVVLQSPDWLWVFDETGSPVGLSPEPNYGSALFRWVYESDLLPLQQACRRLLQEHEPFAMTFRAVLPDGALVWLEGQGYPLAGKSSGWQAALTAKDITAFKKQEERLTRLAYYDPLTQLPNRRLFQDRFIQSLHMAKRYHHKLAVIYLDLDDFKRINDTYGHATGDELLTMAASRLSHSIREPDTVCRMGGDEFVVLVQQFEHREDVAKIVGRIAQTLNQPFELNGQTMSITSSIGVSCYPEDGHGIDTLLQCADTAMYASKQQGKNHFRFFSNP
ncbi:sensor domain-containing diguanylate cyclase [Paenibacillus elgii]|uniref:sensor domain-containing diguanylate cyclase n=1 Tax=Paenibacillus elgii TaxID=189691 RepID=UPI00203F80E4|nr:sensor domain-containing diguanylate cyclase [Paenibacillus elgii]MCM3270932.1 sensor domain-containing diguanylate cyclase [Paenibacillus elgii]